MTEPVEELPPKDRNVLERLYRNSVLRYLLVGGTAFLFDAGLLALFHEVLLWPTWLAAGTAFLLSFIFTYTLQRFFAFQSQLPHGKAIFRYIVLVVFNTFATMLLVELISFTPVGWFGAKVITTAMTTVWNYFVYRLWVFPPPKAAERP